LKFMRHNFRRKAHNFRRKATGKKLRVPIGVASMRQEEAIASSCFSANYKKVDKDYDRDQPLESRIPSLKLPMQYKPAYLLTELRINILKSRF